jgi:hypothetical protein
MDPSDQQSTHLSEADLKDEVLIDLRGSDVTLISCDGARFQVHQNTLSLASPFFEGMFDLAKSSTPTVEIPMVETASVLETLIRFIYPISPRAEIVTIDQVKHTLEAAHKLELYSVEDEVRRHLHDMLASDTNPLRAWALAVILDEDVSRKSAMLRFLCLDNDQLSSVAAQALEELQSISAKDYTLLLKWRADTVNQAHAIIMPRSRNCPRHHDTHRLSDICESSANPFILLDHPKPLVNAWMQCATRTSKHVDCTPCAASFNDPESVTPLFSHLRSIIDHAKGQCNYHVS